MAIAAADVSSSAGNAYRLGATVMMIAIAVILAALAFEHVWGYAPCPLCLQQRYAYYAGIPAAFLSLVLLSTGRPGPAAAVMFLVSLTFLANAGVGVYHAGAEWKFWPGPATCGTIQEIGTSGGGVLGAINETRVIRCDEAPWRLAGLSFAGWNVVASFLLSVLALKASFEAR